MSTTLDKILDIGHRLTEAAIAAGGVTFSLHFGADAPDTQLRGDIEQLATGLEALQTIVVENDQVASAVIGRLESEQREDRAQLAGVVDRLTEAEGGLVCGHDCGSYGCPTLRADWGREGFSCGNGGCPRREA
jgi:hypothetical protein